MTRIKELAPDLEVDGEMQVDSAVDFDLLQSIYPFANLTGPANVLVFPNLSAANTAYKLMGQIGGAEVIGPMLTRRGFSALSRAGSICARKLRTVEELVNVTQSIQQNPRS